MGYVARAAYALPMKESSESARHAAACALLREIRSSNELTQVEVATRLGKPQSYVSKYESGERRLDVAELMGVCAALDITLVDFARALTERVA